MVGIFATGKANNVMLNNINDEHMFNPEARGGVSRLIWDENEKKMWGEWRK